MRRPGSAKSAAPGATSLVAPEEILGEFFLQGRKSGGFYFKTRKTYGNKKVAGCQSAKPKHLLGKKNNNSPWVWGRRRIIDFFCPKDA